MTRAAASRGVRGHHLRTLENVPFTISEPRDIIRGDGMAYRLELPRRLKVKGWKVKIQGKERLEPPHITVYHGEKVWRIGLRNRDFMVPPGGIRQ